jgi:ParB-like chromosome segregation protein Spo0J
MKIDQPSLFDPVSDISELVGRAKNTFELLKLLSQDDRIEAINQIRLALHTFSPFAGEPVDCVQWVKADLVQANDYNPNSVAPPEMELLRVSIAADGFTQPIVTFPVDGKREVVDGFHRNRVGKECKDIRERTLGYLPVVAIKQSQSEKGNRIASTIRHNRARGKHKVDAMSDIVVELKRRNWSDERIAKNLGMDQDEILRLMQITGLTEFSKSWDVEGEVNESDFNELTDNVDEYGDEVKEFRTVNTSDENRIFHTYDKWECHKAGFYAGSKEGMKKDECEEAYRAFLSDPQKFSNALEHVIDEWKHSCEHYLTNASMNRIAWLGQAAACYALGIPAVFRSGFYLLTEQQQQEANEVALKYLNKWLQANGREAVSMEVAYSGDRQSDIY